MKNTLNRLIAIFFPMLLLFSELGYSENENRSEIMAFVGTRIAPAIPGKKSGQLPGWHTLNGLTVGNTTTLWLTVEDGYTENEYGFVLKTMDKDSTQRVIDARVIPSELRRYDVKGGKAVERKDYKNIYDVADCMKADAKYPIIGLMHPEREDCLHHSRLVKMAWRVNEATGKLEEISTTGVLCFFPNAEDDCE